jgi:hypothetical protein
MKRMKGNEKKGFSHSPPDAQCCKYGTNGGSHILDDSAKE